MNLINPPRYTGGYARMFAGIDSVFDWDQPAAAQFEEKDYAKMMDQLAEDPALSLMYYATDGDDPAPQWGNNWRSVFADRPAVVGVSAINWIIANRDPVSPDASRGMRPGGKYTYKLFDGEITKDTNVRNFMLDRGTGDYYRDLFIHKLPGSVTETYSALLLDGQLAAVVGMHLSDWRSGKVITKYAEPMPRCASLTFAFTANHEKYSRLHKLTLMAITSSWFFDDLFSDRDWYVFDGPPMYVKTVMLTKHPENKTARGILNMMSREPQKDGTYKLYYSAKVQVCKREDTLNEWLKKYSTLTK